MKFEVAWKLSGIILIRSRLPLDTQKFDAVGMLAGNFEVEIATPIIRSRHSISHNKPIAFKKREIIKQEIARPYHKKRHLSHH